ncbi:hypothetical protein QZQ15_05795 [Serratia marcescens]|uniref:hypothetical protein n=1 Tax=Serratia marcescens TaxID=615 RepID=UPI00279293C0|nr:hypothetical protein [Serratia marcescens]MDP8797509.1 hypothetical protein [Serratia marcescens]
MSKPVRIHRDWNRASMCHCGKCDRWEMTIADSDGVQTCASCYDAEWLSEWQDYAEVADKRIAELEAIATDYIGKFQKAQDANKHLIIMSNDDKRRIAELESANTSQDDHINQQQDRIDSLEKTNAGLGRRLGEAEKRIIELDYLRLSACEVFKEIGNELGCNPDNESIMMAIDALKERLAAPVRLLGEMLLHDWEHSTERQATFQHRKIAWDARLAEGKKAILAAGFTFTVEGDE